MVKEDFTTYTEVEPDDRIQKTSYHVDILTDRTEDSYLYDDKGVNFFGDFTHLIDGKVVNHTGIAAECSIWILSNYVDDTYGQQNAGNKYISIRFLEWSGNKYISIDYWDGSSVTRDLSNFAYIEGTMYFFKVQRAGSTLTCEIRTGSQSGTLKDTLSLTVTTDTFRYIYAGCSFNDAASGYQMNNDIENLILGKEYSEAFSEILNFSEISTLSRVYFQDFLEPILLEELIKYWRRFYYIDLYEKDWEIIIDQEG